ncbi:MAG TPA: hypothetical protein VGR57_01090 [Ktedonobacterales bacterium]|nr:hypothetical protein [Ktedonobacterales bacterium]
MSALDCFGANFDPSGQHPHPADEMRLVATVSLEGVVRGANH